jgi:hypothetical protein
MDAVADPPYGVKSEVKRRAPRLPRKANSMTDGRSHSTPRSGLPRIIKRLKNQLMTTPRGLVLAAACCFLYASCGFVVAYDWMAATDRPASLRVVATLLFLWLGVEGLREGKRLWIRRGVLRRTET